MSDLDLSASEVVELPSLGADMDYGTILEWRVAPGDTVHRGDVVALVATEKSDIDVEVWQSGVVEELLIDVGREVPVGTPMLRLRGEVGTGPPESGPAAVSGAEPGTVIDVGTAIDVGTRAPEPVPGSETGGAVPPATPPAVTPPTTGSEPGSGRPAPAPSADRPGGASPLARTRAAELGLDLASIHGSGPDGAVLIADVEVAASAPATVPAEAPPRPARPDRAAGMRRAIAERMANANRDIPHYHLELDVDLGSALDWLEIHNRDLPVSERVLPAALFVQATARAAARHPECNGSWIDGSFVPAERVDIGLAISLRKGGLVTPVIARADERSLDEIMAAIKELVAGARSGALRSSWMIDAGITLTNLGDNGAPRVHGVIFPPQVALVGVGSINRRPWVVDDLVVPRPIVTVSFAGDHRATDGAVGSRFLATFAHHLEQLEEP